MAHTLSDALASLSAKSKSVEDKVARAGAEGKAKLDAQLAEARSYAETKKSEFTSKATAARTDADRKLSTAKNAFQEKIAQLKAQATAKKADIEAKVAARKQQVNLKDAEWDYNDAVDYAQNCIDWAIIALADVEEASLEALAAAARYDSLKSTAR
jgi:vacuolar-type H+-ATPase subunit I/STV1